MEGISLNLDIYCQCQWTTLPQFLEMTFKKSVLYVFRVHMFLQKDNLKRKEHYLALKMSVRIKFLVPFVQMTLSRKPVV